MKKSTEIEINLSGSGAPSHPRHMYVVFTLEHRAYSVDEACELARRLRADGVEDELYVINIDCGDDIGRSFDGLRFLPPPEKK